MFGRDWTMSSNFMNYLTLNREHDWVDLCIRLSSQQACTSNDHEEIVGGLLFNVNLDDASS